MRKSQNDLHFPRSRVIGRVSGLLAQLLGKFSPLHQTYGYAVVNQFIDHDARSQKSTLAIYFENPKATSGMKRSKTNSNAATWTLLC